jgi:hypothetical protein
MESYDWTKAPLHYEMYIPLHSLAMHALQGIVGNGGKQEALQSTQMSLDSGIKSLAIYSKLSNNNSCYEVL